jgi:hypothetical protein
VRGGGGGCWQCHWPTPCTDSDNPGRSQQMSTPLLGTPPPQLCVVLAGARQAVECRKYACTQMHTTTWPDHAQHKPGHPACAQDELCFKQQCNAAGQTGLPGPSEQQVSLDRVGVFAGQQRFDQAYRRVMHIQRCV